MWSNRRGMSMIIIYVALAVIVLLFLSLWAYKSYVAAGGQYGYLCSTFGLFC